MLFAQVPMLSIDETVCLAAASAALRAAQSALSEPPAHAARDLLCDYEALVAASLHANSSMQHDAEIGVRVHSVQHTTAATHT